MGLVDWWHSRKQEPVESTTDSPGPSSEGEVDPNTDNSSDHSQSPQVSADQNEEHQQEAPEEPVQKKGLLERFSFFKKAPPSPEAVEIAPMESEDVFSPPRKKGNKIDENSKNGKNSNLEDGSPGNEDFVRVKVWLRRNRSEPFRPAKFCDCIVDYFATADQRNIYSAPTVSVPGLGNTLNIPQTGGSLKDPSDKSSIHSSSEYLSWSGLSTPFGCCSVSRSPLPSSTRLAANHSCCLHAPKTEAISVTVECIVQDNRVLMQPAPEDAYRDRRHGTQRSWRRSSSAQSFIAVLEHPPFCGAHRISPKDYADLPDGDKQRGVDVGVSVLLESSDHRLLITRRAQHMRTFPGVWVPPGGHVDDTETVIEAGMREVFEETGLRLEKGKEPDSIFLKLPKSEEEEGSSQEDSERIFDDEDENRYTLLGLWESCFPPVLYVGVPKKQHLVYYIHVALSQSADVIDKHLKLERSEVEACVWLDRSHAEVVAYSSRPLPDTPIPITVLDPNTGMTSPGTLDPKVLRKKMPEPSREIERLTTGTRFAIKLWLGHRDDQEEAEPRATEEAEPRATSGAEPRATSGAEPRAMEEAEPSATEEAEPSATEEAEPSATEEAESSAAEP